MIARIAGEWRRVIDFTSRDRFLIGASVFRIVAGLTILYQYLISYYQRHYLFGPDGVWPFDTFLESLAGTRSFSLYAVSRDPLAFEVIFHLGIVVTALWVLGWRTRLLTPLTYVFLWSLHERASFLLDGGDNVLQIVLFYAIFADVGAYFSWDANRLRAARQRGGAQRQVFAMLHSAALLAFALQLCLVYGVAGLYKVQGELWQSGTAMYYVMRVNEFTWPGYSEYIYLNVPLTIALTYLTVAFQVSFPFMLFLNRWTRRLALLAGFSFHLGIGVFMGLVTFSALMISVELALIADNEYRQIGRWFGQLRRWAGGRISRYVVVLRRAPALESQRVQLFYDGWCPFCRQSIATLQRLDLLRLLEPISFREPGVLAYYQLDAARAEARIQARAVRADASVEGIVAVQLVASRLPALWPTLPLLWAASRLGVGQYVYDWIAARRTIIPTGCTTQCAVHHAGDNVAKVTT